MPEASSPRLCATNRRFFKRIRSLPVPGQLTVKIGDMVESSDIVAQADQPLPLQPIHITSALGIPPAEIESSLVVKVGEKIAKDALIAETRAFFGLFHSTVKAPFNGTLESISKVTGHAMMRPPPRSIQLRAFMPGRVVEIIPNRGIVIEGEISHIQGIFGLGGETYGKLSASSTTEIGTDLKGQIIARSTPLSWAEICFFIERKAAGIIAPAADGIDLMRLTEGQLNPAATGEEAIGTTIVLTEGFGDIPMAAHTWNLLEKLEGLRVSLSGATQIRAGVIRPELVAEANNSNPSNNSNPETQEKQTVRIIRGPKFGMTGTIESVPTTPQYLESNIKSLVYQIRLPDGKVVIVPRPNTEIVTN